MELDSRLDKNRYGKILIKNDENIKQKTIQVHRYSFSTYNNIELTSFDVICHQCHNRKCFNPKHLIKSTQLNNTIKKLRDWNEFKDDISDLVNEYMKIKEKLKKRI